MATTSPFETANAALKVISRLNNFTQSVGPVVRMIASVGNSSALASRQIGSGLWSAQMPLSRARDSTSGDQGAPPKPRLANAERFQNFAQSVGAGQVRTFARKMRADGLESNRSSIPGAIKAVAATVEAIRVGDGGAKRVSQPISRTSHVAPLNDSKVKPITLVQRATMLDQTRPLAGIATDDRWSTPAFAAPTSFEGGPVGLEGRYRLRSPSFSDLPSQSRSTLNAALPAPVTLNSTPTVVVSGATDPLYIEQRITAALRRHREELFDEIKREAARRERICF
jgi:hypothetical protein